MHSAFRILHSFDSVVLFAGRKEPKGRGALRKSVGGGMPRGRRWGGTRCAQTAASLISALTAPPPDFRIRRSPSGCLPIRIRSQPETISGGRLLTQSYPENISAGRLLTKFLTDTFPFEYFFPPRDLSIRHFFDRISCRHFLILTFFRLSPMRRPSYGDTSMSGIILSLSYLNFSVVRWRLFYSELPVGFMKGRYSLYR